MTEPLIMLLLAGSSARWRHPLLAAELSTRGGAVGVAESARLLLPGLARPRSLAESLEDLIAEERFETAEEMLLEVLDRDAGAAGEPGIDAEDWTTAEGRIVAARASAVADLGRRWVDLQARAAAIGLRVPDEPPVLTEAQRSVRAARDLLREREELIRAKESDLKAALGGRLEKHIAALPDGRGRGQWEQAVGDSIEAGEYEVAKDLVDAGPDHMLDAGPLTVPPPPMHWPWPERRPDEVLAWYAGERAPGPEFERYRPAAGDESWRLLHSAVGRLLGKVDGPAVRDVAVALADLLGKPAAPPVESAGRAGYVTRLFGLDDARMPRLPLLSPDGVALWVASDGEARPPAGVPVIWFRPLLALPPAADGDTDAVPLVLADLLRVLAPDPSRRATDAATRRIALLRILVPRVPLGELLGAGGLDLGAGASQRDSLAWLFDLLGLLPDRPVLTGLLYDSGRHPVALRYLVEALIAEVRGKGRRVTLEHLAVARRPAERERIRAALLPPLTSDAPAAAVLWLTLLQYGSDDEFDGAGVVDGLGLLDLPADVAGLLPSYLQVDRALATLRDQGLLRAAGEGRLTPPMPGLVRILCGDGGDGDLREKATAAVIEAAGRSVAMGRATAAVAGERVVRLIGHKVDNDVLSIRRLLTEAATATDDPALRAMIDAVGRKVGDLGGGAYVDAYQQALEPPLTLDVGDLVRSVVGEVEGDWDLPRGTRIDSMGEEGVYVSANSWVLRESIRNLVRNAVAVLGRGTEPGAIAIIVRTDQHTAGAPLIPPPAVVIEVADNGPGFDPASLALYRAGLEGMAGAAASTTSRVGTGLRQTHHWLRDYGGALEFGGRSADLGGAAVRIWLPRTPAPPLVE